MTRKIWWGIAGMMVIGGQTAWAQGELEALNMARTDVLGTARYMGMAGAMGAVGGDASAVVLNPAGLGIYRKSEVSVTPLVQLNHAEGETPSGTYEDNMAGFNVGNCSVVIDFNSKRKKGLLNSAFAFSYNRETNLRAHKGGWRGGAPASASDYMAFASYGANIDNLNTELSNAFDGTFPYVTDLAWQTGMINPVTDDATGEYTGKYISFLENGEKTNSRFNLEEKGGINQFNFGYGMNFNDTFFAGVSLGLYNINYKATSVYHEDYELGGYFNLRNTLHTTGVGADFKFGMIVMPTDFLRIGFAVHTPTYYTLDDKGNASVSASTEEVSDISFDVRNKASYRYQTSYKILPSLAFIIAKKGIVSIDYQLSDYGKLKLKDKDDSWDDGWYSHEDYDYNPTLYDAENEKIKSDFKKRHLIKIGGEYRVTDEISLRAGFAYATKPVKDEVESRNYDVYPAGTVLHYAIPQENYYGAFGIGYRTDRFFIDAAYQINVQRENLYTFYDPNAISNGISSSKIKDNLLRHNIALTMGVKF